LGGERRPIRESAGTMIEELLDERIIYPGSAPSCGLADIFTRN
jgi:hypothetical protein